MGLGSTNPTIARYKSLLTEVGRGGLNAMFPNDFEAYFCSLELVNSKGKVIEFFVFPIMPTHITHSSASLSNVKKTAGGVTVMNSTTFIPIDISINGNFGRRFKFLVGKSNPIDANAIRFSTQGGAYTKQSITSGALQIKNAVFNTQIKTGYGCIKILEAIYDKSNTIDEDGNPYRLYFYNPALGNSYLVKGINLTLSQTYDQNMIWQYNLQMKAIAPITGVREDDGKGSLTKTMQYAILSKAIDITASAIKQQLLTLPNKVDNFDSNRDLNFVSKRRF